MICTSPTVKGLIKLYFLFVLNFVSQPNWFIEISMETLAPQYWGYYFTSSIEYSFFNGVLFSSLDNSFETLIFQILF
jgi:hypothetical protein